MLPKHSKKGDKVAIVSFQGILHRKPMDEKYFNEYKSSLIEIVYHPKLSYFIQLKYTSCNSKRYTSITS